MTTVAYDAAFFELIRPGCQSSAAVVVPLVMSALGTHAPHHVVDVGCGEGWWAQAFADRGCRVMGVDGSYPPASPLGPDRFLAHDLAQPLNIGQWDLAVCLEVAEHLPESRAAGLVDDLCRAAPVILWSAAVPGQGGHGHINEQWPGYWTALFAARGYAVSAALRWAVWDDDRVEPWYRQNLLIAASTPGQWPALFDTPLAATTAVVHPAVFTGRVAS